VLEGGPRLDGRRAAALAAALRAAQRSSSAPAGCTRPRTSPPAGELVRAREDVGRHNAMDKLVGASLLAGELPLAEGWCW
jgi:FdhD protein